MEYDLYSNDWLNIELMYSEHMRAETLYAEQMSRWGLQHGRAWGVVHMGENDFQVHGSSSGYEVSLRYCKAITRNGYIVDITPRQMPITHQGSNEWHRENMVPVYLGVAVEKVSANAGASQTGALLDRPALRWSYELAVEPASAYFDWIQIGRLRRDGQRFIRDDNYIPQCVHLKSHPALVAIALDITRAAERALQALERATKVRNDGTDISPAWLALMGVMMTTLAPATVLVDRDLHPRQYLQQSAATLRAYAALLPLLGSNVNWEKASGIIRQLMKLLDVGETNASTPETSNAASGANGSTYASEYGEATTLVQSYGGATAANSSGEFAPEQMRRGLFWWDSFDLVRQAFQALIVLFEALTPSVTAPGQPQPPPGQSVVQRAALPVKRI